ncbi:trigger factor [Paralimibaculum aggregatum]|uniref:Trigger factor n=1 Tax=Paralimibaculum aggregatum TaxID=3036245 RepID=A0ABQ6LTP4_9RHOB|nr:trigger factor [Limibaculum sp. NKW23]GMG85449.1 trigger factor [Limibaculum sp. NKW23]
MQVTETKSEGLRREYSVVVSAEALEAKTNEKLETVRADFHMKGFRKGKAPLPLLKRMFGKSVLGEVVQETVEQTVQTHLTETGHRPAQQPDIKIANENFQEGDDLTVEIAYDCLPEVPEVDYAAIALERHVVEVDEDAVEDGLKRLAESATGYEPKEGAAENGDQAVIDFVGKVDGEAFEGGTAEDYPLVLGSNSFIPGFEEQLVGLEAGAEKAVEVKFPEEYGAPHLAGKDAVFDVTVKEVRGPVPAEIDDALAERYGAENLEALKTQLRERIGDEFAGASRQLVKRRLLDKLDELVSFELPPTLVEAEAKSIAHQLWHDENPDVHGHDHPAIEATEEHTRLAERRVRLGLLLADIGTKEAVEVTEQEIGQAVMQQARQYPGQEREFFEFVKSNRQAMEQIRAPLFEDKVVDLILEKVTITDVSVSKDALQAELEALDEEDGEAVKGEAKAEA